MFFNSKQDCGETLVHNKDTISSELHCSRKTPNIKLQSLLYSRVDYFGGLEELCSYGTRSFCFILTERYVMVTCTRIKIHHHEDRLYHQNGISYHPKDS